MENLKIANKHNIKHKSPVSKCNVNVIKGQSGSVKLSSVSNDSTPRTQHPIDPVPICVTGCHGDEGKHTESAEIKMQMLISPHTYTERQVRQLAQPVVTPVSAMKRSQTISGNDHNITNRTVLGVINNNGSQNYSNKMKSNLGKENVNYHVNANVTPDKNITEVQISPAIKRQRILLGKEHHIQTSKGVRTASDADTMLVSKGRLEIIM